MTLPPYPRAAAASEPLPPGWTPAPTYQPAPPKKKKSKVWLVILIIVVALALIGAGGFYAYKTIIGNRNTAYCQTYVQLGSQLPGISDRLGQAQSKGDLRAVSSALDEMITAFSTLQAATPPADATAPLTSIISYLQDLKGLADAGDVDQYNAYVTKNGASVFQSSASAIDTTSVAYCS